MPAKSTTAAGTASPLIPRVRRTMSSRSKQGRLLAAVIVLSGGAACVSSSALDRPYDVPGTASETGCDASFDSSFGSFRPERTEMRFTLQNSSTSAPCRATVVTLQLNGATSPEAIHLTAPRGWVGTKNGCAKRHGVCAVTWRSRVGVGPGESAAGFEFKVDRPSRCEPKVWIVQVGARRVAIPFGCVTGKAGPL
jgi:hypothetical protein